MKALSEAESQRRLSYLCKRSKLFGNNSIEDHIYSEFLQRSENTYEIAALHDLNQQASLQSVAQDLCRFAHELKYAPEGEQPDLNALETDILALNAQLTPTYDGAAAQAIRAQQS